MRGFLASTFEKAGMSAADRRASRHSSASCWAAATYAIIGEIVEPRHASVLDLGCGEGELLRVAGAEQGRGRARRRDLRRQGAARHRPRRLGVIRAISTKGWPIIPTRPSIT